jgi:uncharacterized coiled-coil protein SlyX
MSNLQNELAAAKAEAAARVHKLERAIDLQTQIDYANQRIVKREAEIAADRATLEQLTAELAKIQ